MLLKNSEGETKVVTMNVPEQITQAIIKNSPCNSFTKWPSLTKSSMCSINRLGVLRLFRVKLSLARLVKWPSEHLMASRDAKTLSRDRSTKIFNARPYSSSIRSRKLYLSDNTTKPTRQSTFSTFVDKSQLVILAKWASAGLIGQDVGGRPQWQ